MYNKKNTSVFYTLLMGVSLAMADGPVIQTGQTIEYYPGDDGTYKAGIERSYVRDDALGIVTDNATGLQWQDNIAPVSEPWLTQDRYDAGDYYNTSGDTATNYCNQLMISGISDWRLPTAKELATIIDLTRETAPLIDSVFEHTVEDIYWVSDTWSLNAKTAWYIDFHLPASRWGIVSTTLKKYTFHVRCVRGNSLHTSTYFRDTSLDTVYDEVSKLTWQDDAIAGEETHQFGSLGEAIDYCEGLNFANYEDWRVPNFNELLSIVNYSQYPSINPVFKYVAQYNDYSTSTRIASIGSSVSVDCSSGHVSNSPSQLRCVRGGETHISTTVVKNDFNADGYADILWGDDGFDYRIWYMSPTGKIGSRSLGIKDWWRVEAIDDFNGDGYADILWQKDNNAYTIWLMDDTGKVGTIWIGIKSGWSVEKTGDIDGDGKADILWNKGGDSGYDFSIWLMDENGQKGTVGIGTQIDWNVDGMGDFDGDGKTDILWRRADGVSSIWLMDENGKRSAIQLGVKTGWKVKGIGDIDGDGKEDIFWQKDNGKFTVWLIDETGKHGTVWIGKKEGWDIVNVNDFDGDGKADIIWEKPNGAYVIWLMTESGLKEKIWVTDKAMIVMPTDKYMGPM